jgi:hypothetical protein
VPVLFPRAWTRPARAHDRANWSAAAPAVGAVSRGNLFYMSGQQHCLGHNREDAAMAAARTAIPHELLSGLGPCASTRGGKHRSRSVRHHDACTHNSQLCAGAFPAKCRFSMIKPFFRRDRCHRYVTHRLTLGSIRKKAPTVIGASPTPLFVKIVSQCGRNWLRSRDFYVELASFARFFV